MNNVINTVTTNLAGKLSTKLPSLCRIMSEAKFIANQHVASEIISTTDIENHKSATLHNDGTTKYHKEYKSYQVTLSTGKTMSMGLDQVSGQSAGKNIACFQNLISRLVMSLKNMDEDVAMVKLIVSLQNTVSSQGSSNPNFFKQVNILRAEILPVALENWADEELRVPRDEHSHYFI